MSHVIAMILVTALRFSIAPFAVMSGQEPPSVILMIGVTFEHQATPCRHHHLGLCIGDACAYSEPKSCP